MATSSIYNRVKIKTAQDAQRVIQAMEQAEQVAHSTKEPTYHDSVVEIKNAKEIQKLFRGF
jgi:hypothetical protein